MQQQMENNGMDVWKERKKERKKERERESMYVT